MNGREAMPEAGSAFGDGAGSEAAAGIRLLIADDHPVVRAGVRAMLEAEDDLVVVADVDRADAAVRRAADGDVDVVLMDLQFPSDMQGAEATRHIRSLDDAPRVLVLTNYDTDADILSAIEAGASGYLLKDSPPGELTAAIRAAATGEPAFAPGVSSRLDANDGLERLTGREAEVLGLVASGHTNREIGRALFLSEATVKSHLVHIFTKLEVGSRTAAVARARALGIIRSN